MKAGSIKASAAISYISIGLNIIIALVYTPWMISQLGKSEYGIYALVGTFISYFLFDFGMGSSISRFVSKYKEAGDTQGLKKLYGVIATVYLSIDVILVLVLSVLYFFIEDLFGKLTPGEMMAFKEVYVIAAFFSICNFTFVPLNGTMTAHEFFVPLKVSEMIQRVGTVILIAVALYLGGRVYSLIFINGAVALAISLYKLTYLYRRKALSISLRHFDWLMAKSLFGFSLWIFLINLAQRLRVNIVPAVLGAKSGTSEISLFSLAMAIEGFVWTFAYALNGLFLPRVTKMVQAGTDRKEITHLMTRVGRFQLFIIGLIIIGFVGLGKPFVRLWVGEGFIDTYLIAVCLILPGVFTLTQQIGTTLSYVENEVKYNSIISISAAVLSFGLCLLLAPSMGAVGCGIGVLTALILSVVALNIFYKKKLKLDVIFFFKNCHLKILPVLMVFLFGVMMFTHYVSISNWLVFLVVGSIFVVLYCLIAFFFLFNREEKATVKGVLCRFSRKKHTNVGNSD